MRTVIIFINSLILIAFLAAGLAVPSALSAETIDDYVKLAKEAKKKYNWDNKKTVTVGIKEFGYEPNKLVFKTGQTYKLEIINIGKEKHYFTAPEFFRAIATRKAQNKLAEIKAPFFLALEIMPKGGQLDLYFVPLKKGTYPVYCTRPDHRKKGGEGKIIIE
ncbi:MAG: cupredoxin domain-containing protein [Candidatus Desulfatibia sp.]|uniref:cupredoxin domain-containing protein n=1 Tax=Candidatus Desulfatibia sp. TaxID=3101189 RepID=UPI002F3194FD